MKASENGRTRPASKTKKDISASYNEYKEFGGQQYTGMKVGRSHKWYYDKGTWKETKITPDLWKIDYEVIKRRAGKAPKGSGVPVGTEYNWYILSHQHVRKLDANSYTTSMKGWKYKLAHKRAGNEKWSITGAGQKKRLIKLLQDFIESLENKQEDTKQKTGSNRVKGIKASVKNKKAKKKEVLEPELF
jgi:hypothetical protein